MSLKAQGDLMLHGYPVGSRGNDSCKSMIASYGKSVTKKANNGATIIHEGEKGDHFHVLEGEECTVHEIPTSAVGFLTGQGLKAWVIDAPKGAVLKHVKGDGTPTGGHGDVAVDPGTTIVHTQREQSYLDARQIPQYD